MGNLERSARQASNSPAMAAVAKFGLFARGFIYLVIGWLAVQIALGHHTHEANQRGALVTVAGHPFGQVLLWILGFGFGAYALWRLSEAAFGTAAEGRKTGPRLQSLIRGVVYATFAVTTFSFIAGTSNQTQSRQQETTTAKLMKHGYGRWLVGIVGVIVIVVGIGLIIEGLRKKFEKQLRMDELHGVTRTVVVRLGMVGTTSRGIVFAVAGALLVQAALQYQPAKSTGLDGALRTLADQPYGPWLLGAIAVGLIAFGVYGLFTARFAKT
ncbi:MAG: hypothetical protein QOH17_4968 [Pseudonocardiales bacterium]|nr:hypothetical protein [Pseudonocardiales bacterium]